MEETYNIATPTAIAVLGKPGAGKSTTAKWMANRLSLPFFDSGDIIRDKIAENAELKAAVSSGTLIPSETCLQFLQQEIAEQDLTKGFILVGFPRNTEQYPLFNSLCNNLGLTNIVFLDIHVSDDTAKYRADCRREKAEKSNSARADDTAETFAQRIEEYNQSTGPLLKLLAEQSEHRFIQVAADRAKKKDILKALLQEIG